MRFTVHDRRRMRHAANQALEALKQLYNLGDRELAKAGGPFSRLAEAVYIVDSHEGSKSMAATDELMKELAIRTEAAELYVEVSRS